jgi:hypothetical protein
MKSPYAYWTGVGIVVATHAYMLGVDMPKSMNKYHAYLNIGAAGLLIYGGMD